MSARIVFTGGAEVTVDQEPAEVKEKLAKDQSGGDIFSTFTEANGAREVFVAADQVALVSVAAYGS